MKRLIQIDFNEALERTRKGDKVYVVNIGKPAPTTRLFKKLTIEEAVEHSDDIVFQIVEEAAE